MIENEMIRIYEAGTDKKCYICQVCLTPSTTLEEARDKTRGKKMVSLPNGGFCLTHGLESVLKIQQHVNEMVGIIKQLKEEEI